MTAFLVLALGACGAPTQDYGKGPKSTTPVSDGPTVGRSPQAALDPLKDDPPAETSGVVRFVARDRRTGRERAGVPVAYRHRSGGPEHTTFTGSRGTANVTLPAGFYIARVPVGCSKTQVVHYGDDGVVFGVAAGRSVGAVLNSESDFLFRASGPIEWSVDPPWPREETVSFSFHLTRHLDCGGTEAPNTSFGDLRFKASGVIEILNAPTRSKGDATAVIKIRCNGRGNGNLVIYDPQNPSDTNDLLRFRAAFTAGEWCA